MQWSIKIFLMTCVLLAGCSNNVNRAFYEGFKSQNDGYKTPNEKTTSPPAPSYDVYKKERDNLQSSDPSLDQHLSQ